LDITGCLQSNLRANSGEIEQQQQTGSQRLSLSSKDQQDQEVNMSMASWQTGTTIHHNAETGFTMDNLAINTCKFSLGTSLIEF
jgi:hypothetical protein